MTQENRELAYKHFRDLEANYEAPEGLSSGLTKASVLRQHAKEIADALLLRNPELEAVIEIKTEPKVTKSKGKK